MSPLRPSCLTDGEFSRHHWIGFPKSERWTDSADRRLVQGDWSRHETQEKFHGCEKESRHR